MKPTYSVLFAGFSIPARDLTDAQTLRNRLRDDNYAAMAAAEAGGIPCAAEGTSIYIRFGGEVVETTTLQLRDIPEEVLRAAVTGVASTTPLREAFADRQRAAASKLAAMAR